MKPSDLKRAPIEYVRRLARWLGVTSDNVPKRLLVHEVLRRIRAARR